MKTTKIMKFQKTQLAVTNYGKGKLISKFEVGTYNSNTRT
jgi:hypothetical protein